MKNNRRKTKIAVFAFFAVAAFLLVGSKFSSAQQDPPKKAASGMVLADVNIRDAKIEKQENNVLTISFNISNDFDKIQPGILLRASLVKNENNTRITADEKIIGSEFTLEAKEKSHREITYTVPDFIQGKYEIWLEAQTAGGIPLSTMRVGETTFSGTNDYVEIVNNSCFLKVKGESEDKKYVPTQGVDIEKNENLQAVCDLMNHSDRQKKFSAQFQTFQTNTFGALLETSEKSDVSFTLQPKEKKQVFFDLPKAKDPQAYDIKLMLQENKKTISNSSVFHYVLRGASATIQSLQMDKDSYQKGEKARVSVMVTGPADNFSGSRHGAGTDLKGAVLLAKIQSGQTLCSQIKITPNLIGMPNDIGIAIAENCPEPAVLVLIKDSAGNVLAQRNFFVGKNSQAEMEKMAQLQANEKNGKSFATILTILITLLIILIIIFIIWKFKKKSSFFVPILFFGLGLAISLHVAHPARAGYVQLLDPPCEVCETWECPDPYDANSCYNLNTCDDGMPVCDSGTVSYGASFGLDKSVYFPGENLTASVYSNGANGYDRWSGEVSVIFNNQNYVVVYPGGHSGSVTGTADSWPGSYSATFTLWGQMLGIGEHADAGEPYQVVQPPQNGACGWANGTAGCGPPPDWSLSLCSVGPPSGVSDYGNGNWSWSCGGTGGGSNASCWAGKSVIDGACGLVKNTCDPGAVINPVETSAGWSWSCNASCNGDTPSCFVPKVPIPGQCGSADGDPPACSKPTNTADLCANSTTSSIVNWNDSTKQWEWTCSGIYGSTVTSPLCTEKKVADPKPGSESNAFRCAGYDIHTNLSGLCIDGSPSITGAEGIVTSSLPAKWTCKNSCDVPITCTNHIKGKENGQCGTVDGKSICDGRTLSDAELCSSGIIPSPKPDTSGYDATWTCGETCGGTSASCSARGKKSCGWKKVNP